MRALLRPRLDQFALGLSIIRRQVIVKLVQSPLHVTCLEEVVNHIELLPIRVVGSAVLGLLSALSTGRPLSSTRHGCFSFAVLIGDEQDKVKWKLFYY